MNKLLLLSIIFFVATSWAVDSDCEKALTVDQRFLKFNDDLENEKHIPKVVSLLGEAFYPVLNELSERTRAVSTEEVQAMAHKVAKKLDKRRLSRLQIQFFKKSLAEDSIKSMYGFDGVYPYVFSEWKVGTELIEIYGESFGVIDDDVGYTLANEKIMIAMIAALSVVADELLKMDIEMRESERLRTRVTYHKDAIAIFADSFISMLFTFSQLTVEKKRGLSDIELVERILLPQGKSSMSLLNMAAIFYAPAVIGPKGNKYYYKKPLTYKNDCLQFSKGYMQKLSHGKAIMDERAYYATGNGCPVAHKGGQQRSGLDLLNAAVFEKFKEAYLTL